MIYEYFDKERIKTKVCIIGSGIGGGTTAKKLREQGVDFVVIEAGDRGVGSPNVKYESVGRDFGVRSTTAVALGGTSNLWHGVLAPLDEIDFEKRDWIEYSGWPIDFNNLKPYYKEASGLFGVENNDFFEVSDLDDKHKNQLNELNFNRGYLKNKLFQQPTTPLNFKSIIEEVCGVGGNDCYLNTVALEFVTNENKASTLKVGTKEGRVGYVEADIFVVAAGALETPRLLLNSGFKNCNIGKFLMDHPMGNLCQLVFKNPKKYPIYSDTKYSHNMKIKTGLELTDERQKELRMPNHNFYLRPSFVKGIDDESEKVKLSLLAFKDGGVTIKDVWKVLTSPNVVKQIISYKLSLDVTYKYADLFFVTEQIPNPDSTVSLSDERDAWGYKISKVDWRVSGEDVAKLKELYGLLLKEFFPSAEFEFTHTDSDFNWENIYTSAIHHVGTAKMGSSSADGVVDANLRLFEAENIFVCDGSVFTTAGNVNNGLTISALAHRLADYLKGVL